jgi:hypothetical protein
VFARVLAEIDDDDSDEAVSRRAARLRKLAIRETVDPRTRHHRRPGLAHRCRPRDLTLDGAS